MADLPSGAGDWLLANLRSGLPFLLESSPQLRHYWVEEFAAGGSAVFAAHSGPQPGALAVLAIQPWESELFERPNSVAHVRLVWEPGATADLSAVVDETVEHAQRAGCSLLAARAPAKDDDAIAALSRAGFALVDSLIDYVVDVSEPIAGPDVEGYRIRLARPDDCAATVRLAAKAFEHHFGRFHSDPKIDRAEAGRVYPKWIESAFNGYADFIFVAERDAEVVGCSIWRGPSAAESRFALPIGHYSLGLVALEHAGHGLFKALTLEGIRRLPVRFIEAPTHVQNLPVQRAFDQLGFAETGRRDTFHLWLDR